MGKRKKNEENWTYENAENRNSNRLSHSKEMIACMQIIQIQGILHTFCKYRVEKTERKVQMHLPVPGLKEILNSIFTLIRSQAKVTKSSNNVVRRTFHQSRTVRIFNAQNKLPVFLFGD